MRKSKFWRLAASVILSVGLGSSNRSAASTIASDVGSASSDRRFMTRVFDGLPDVYRLRATVGANWEFVGDFSVSGPAGWEKESSSDTARSAKSDKLRSEKGEWKLWRGTPWSDPARAFVASIEGQVRPKGTSGGGQVVYDWKITGEGVRFFVDPDRSVRHLEHDSQGRYKQDTDVVLTARRRIGDRPEEQIVSNWTIKSKSKNPDWTERTLNNRSTVTVRVGGQDGYKSITVPGEYEITATDAETGKMEAKAVLIVVKVDHFAMALGPQLSLNAITASWNASRNRAFAKYRKRKEEETFHAARFSVYHGINGAIKLIVRRSVETGQGFIMAHGVLFYNNLPLPGTIKNVEDAVEYLKKRYNKDIDPNDIEVKIALLDGFARSSEVLDRAPVYHPQHFVSEDVPRANLIKFYGCFAGHMRDGISHGTKVRKGHEEPRTIITAKGLRLAGEEAFRLLDGIYGKYAIK